MNRIPLGLAFIIVNGEFAINSKGPLLAPRKGALKDAACFSQTFAFLQYQVKAYNDLSAGDMRSLIVEVSAMDHSQYDSIVCCISSHGNQDGIYGSDGLLVHRKAFIDPIEVCDSLMGKPKLFFFQACRVPVTLADSPE
jgi:hypothetical protein